MLDVREEPLTVSEMAEYLKVSEYTVREYAKGRKVPAHKVGGVWRFYLSEFRESRTAAVVDPWVRDDKRRRGNAA